MPQEIRHLREEDRKIIARMKKAKKSQVDLYDTEKYVGNSNYYDNRRNPLSAGNKIDPQTT